MVVAIETARLLIRNFTPTDWAAFQNVILHYQASASAQYEPPWPTSAAEMQGIVAWFAASDDYLCVALKTTGAVIGLLAIERRNDSEAQVHNLGYVFDPAAQGHGYATEGCHAVMRYLFEVRGATAIHTGTHPANQASIHLLSKLGLQQFKEGEFFLSREAWQALPPALPLDQPKVRTNVAMQGYNAHEVKDCYNRTATEYADQFLQELAHKPFDRNLLDRFSDMLPAGSLIYDFGCGSGQTTKYIHDQKRHTIIGLDFSENAIRLAKAHFGDIEFVVDDMLHSNRASSSADGILAFYAVVHFTYGEIAQVLNEWWRLLKPNAVALFSFHVGEEAIEVVDFLGVSGAKAVWQLLDVDPVLAIAEQVGFNVEEAVLRYPYRGYEHESKRAYILLKKVAAPGDYAA